MPTSVIGPLISAGVSYGASKLFGGGGGLGSYAEPLQNFQPVGINAGGLTSSFGQDGNLTVTPSANRMGQVQNIAGTFSTLADRIAAMGATVAPGVSDLRRARMTEIDNAQTAAIGNLRENLQRRRVLGSSFGQDALARADVAFAQAKDRVAADTFLQELDLSSQFLNQEFAARRSSFQTILDEMNLEADVALKLTAKATETLGANARTLALLNAQDAAGRGKFFGDTFAPLFKGIGQGFGNIFGGSGGGKTILDSMPANI